MKCACGCPLSSPFMLAALAAGAASLVSVYLATSDAQEGPSGIVRTAAETEPMPESQPESMPGATPAQHEAIPEGFAPTPFFTPEVDPATLQMATFGGGCFWGVEASFRNIEGVTHSAVGFSGGKVDDPSYVDVCRKETGHAEVVALLFDPSRVSYEELLGVFWKVHDPTQVNRQGPDVGEQYRSVIFAHDEDQQAKAHASRKALQKSSAFDGRGIATQVAEAGPFFRAEEYHQQYLAKRGLDNCHVPGN